MAGVLRNHLLILERKEEVARMLRRQQFKGLPCRFHGLSGETRLEEHSADTADVWGRKEAGETGNMPVITGKRKEVVEHGMKCIENYGNTKVVYYYIGLCFYEVCIQEALEKGQ